MAEFKMAAIIKLSQNEWVKFIYVQNGGNPMMAEFKMAAIIKMRMKYKMVNSSLSQSFVIKMAESNDGSIQDGCHHQVESEWMSEDNKVLCKWQLNPSMAEFKMAAIFKLSQNEWVKLFCAKWLGTNLGKCDNVSLRDWKFQLRWLNPRWWNSSWQNSRWLPSSS